MYLYCDPGMPGSSYRSIRGWLLNLHCCGACHGARADHGIVVDVSIEPYSYVPKFSYYI